MEGDARQLFFLKSVLFSFSESTGLKVNYNKSLMVPINLSEEKLNLLASTFGCSKGSLPFTYLGLPLGLTKPRIEDFLPLVNKCERRQASTSTFLSQAGKLELTNAVLSALPTFHLCSFALPKGVIKQIDKFRKHCLWQGSDINSKKIPKAAWEMICIPKEEGSLGVIDLRKQNEALLLKNLDKFFNHKDIPWVSLVWEKHYPNGKLPYHTKKGCCWSASKPFPLFKCRMVTLASFGWINGASNLWALNTLTHFHLLRTNLFMLAIAAPNSFQFAYVC